MGDRSLRVVFGGALFAGATFAACQSFETTAGDSSDAGSELGVDVASIDDASVDVADGDAESGAKPPEGAIFFDSFDNPLDCGGWVPSFAKLERASPGRTDDRSCLLCLTQDGTSGMGRTTTGAGPGTYQVEAWTRAIGSMADAGTPFIELVATYADGGQATTPQSSGVPQTTAWTRTNVSYPFGASVETAQIVIRVSGSNGDCVLIDDVALLHVP